MIPTWKTKKTKTELKAFEQVKKAETKGDSTCKVFMFVRSLKLPVLKPRQIKIEKKNPSTERISRSSHIADSIALTGA